MKKPRPVKSADRVLQILEYIERNREVSEIEVYRELQIPQSSASMLLASLVKLGYVRKDPVQRSYSPSIKVALLSAWFIKEAMGSEHLMRTVERLRRETRETVTLGVRNSDSIQYVRVLQTENNGCYVDPYVARPLTHSAPGRALLASLPDAEVQEVLDRISRRADIGERESFRDRMLDQILECRERGYAYTEGVWVRGGGAVSMLCPKQELAIGIGAPLERLRNGRDRFVGLLHDRVTVAMA